MRRDGSRDDLRRKLTRGIVLGTGTREQIAMQYADAVMQVLDQEKAANGTLYVPSAPRQYDLLQIRAAFERGDSRRKVMRDFAIGRRKLDEMFPGGLPNALEKAG